MMSCSNCLYFRPGAHAANRDGICRRNPPEEWPDETIDEATSAAGDPDGDGFLVTITAARTYVGWPDVSAHDWCGEWAAPLVDDSAG